MRDDWTFCKKYRVETASRSASGLMKTSTVKLYSYSVYFWLPAKPSLE
jgi:hypothetical protein